MLSKYFSSQVFHCTQKRRNVGLGRYHSGLLTLALSLCCVFFLLSLLLLPQTEFFLCAACTLNHLSPYILLLTICTSPILTECSPIMTRPRDALGMMWLTRHITGHIPEVLYERTQYTCNSKASTRKSSFSFKTFSVCENFFEFLIFPPSPSSSSLHRHPGAQKTTGGNIAAAKQLRG